MDICTNVKNINRQNLKSIQWHQAVVLAVQKEIKTSVSVVLDKAVKIIHCVNIIYMNSLFKITVFVANNKNLTLRIFEILTWQAGRQQAASLPFPFIPCRLHTFWVV